MSKLQEMKKALEVQRLETNIMQLEVRLLEIDEEKEQVAVNIERQKERLTELKEA